MSALQYIANGASECAGWALSNYLRIPEETTAPIWLMAAFNAKELLSKCNPKLVRPLNR